MYAVGLVSRFIIIPFVVHSPHLKPSWPILSLCLDSTIAYCFHQTALDEAALLGGGKSFRLWCICSKFDYYCTRVIGS